MQTMPKKQYTTRLDPDDAKAVEQYREERGLTQAEAIRRLVRGRLDDLDDEAEDNEDAEVVKPATRTLRSGGMASFLQLLQTALLLAIAALVVGL